MAVPCQTDHGVDYGSDRLTAQPITSVLARNTLVCIPGRWDPYPAVLQLVLVPRRLDYQVQVQLVVLFNHFCDSAGEGISHLFGV